MNKENFVIIYCTCPDKAIASGLAQDIVSAKLAACVNIVPGITSVYRWQEKVTTTEEFMLMAKANAKSYEAIQSLILEKHPYDCPEVISCDISTGSPQYLEWLESEAQ